MALDTERYQYRYILTTGMLNIQHISFAVFLGQLPFKVNASLKELQVISELECIVAVYNNKLRLFI